ncbi:MAG: transcriptional repressor [Candidatus Magnetobacterium sp. LHC-1]|uniref:Ferric uptake regulation protein n=1 Tax=Candidatus Magnetobacterium casense TaxID=1455061 RepID=A0ABS6RXH5_9BACT|nr:transcriptional repressor [Candidatus Magnetobacterium casensis]MBF0606285.1 transcriptional repressor [Nitrospirota bacterium]MBV6341137.1 transcriptional repressor [Candidatus Magnetobacterium casensis]
MEKQAKAFCDFLTRNKLKMTYQREIILSIFLDSKRHLSPEELYRLVDDRDKSIGQATVYRTLRLFVASGIAREEDFGDGVKRYEAIYGLSHHDHLICVHCKKMIEVVDPNIEILQEELAKAHGFKIMSHKMDIYGLCIECKDIETLF